MKKIITPIMIFGMILFAGYAFASSGDHQSEAIDELSMSQTMTSGPGWVIPTTVSGASQDNMQANINLQNDREKKPQVNTDDQKAELPVKGAKKGGGGEKTQGQHKVLVDSTNYSVIVGSGADQDYMDSQGKHYKEAGAGRFLVAEVINGTLHIYAGTSEKRFVDAKGNAVGYASLDDAIAYANSIGGGLILVRGDTTYTHSPSTIYIAELKSNVRLYGGYDEHGNRDIVNHASIIDGAVFIKDIHDAEVNGFTVKGGNYMVGGFYIVDSSNITIANSSFYVKTLSSNILIQDSKNGSSVVVRNSYFSDATRVAINVCYYGQDKRQSTITVTGSIFDTRIGIYAGSRATVISSNNNYNNTASDATSLFLSGSSSHIKSENDYFAGGNNYYAYAGATDSSIDIGHQSYSPNGKVADMQLIATSSDTNGAMPGMISTRYSSTASDYDIRDNRYLGQPKDIATKPITAETSTLATPVQSGQIDADKLFITKTHKELQQDARNSLDSYWRPGETSLDQYAEGPGAEQGLKELAAALDGKKDKTDAENAVLDAAQAVLQDGSVDAQTAHDFAEALNYVRVAQSMQGLMEGVDFTAVTKTLEDLSKSNKEAYQGYLDKTDAAYAAIAGILGITSESKLPESYLSMPNITSQMKRKVLVDTALENIKGKDTALLTESEKKAIAIEDVSLKPAKKEYAMTLRHIIEGFVASMKGILADAPVVSVKNTKENNEVLIVVDDRVKE